MQDPWARSRRPSTSESQATTSAPPETNSCVFANNCTLALTAGFRGARPRSAARHVEAKTMVNKALNFYVKTTGKDGAQMRQELVNMRLGDLRRYLERWQARADEVQPLQEKQEQAWKFFRRQGGLRRRTRKEFEEFDHKVMRNIKAMRSFCRTDGRAAGQGRGAERRSEARETKQMEMEDSSSQRRRAWEKLRAPGLFSLSPYLRTGS